MLKNEAPCSLFERRVKDIMNTDVDVNDSVFQLLKLVYLQKMENLDADSHSEFSEENIFNLCKIIDTVGIESFVKLLSALNGGTVTFPTNDEYQFAVYTTLYYYYNEVIPGRVKDVSEKIGLSHDKKKFMAVVRNSNKLKKFIASGATKMFNNEV